MVKEDEDDGDAAKAVERGRISDQRAVSYRVRLWSLSRAALAALAAIVLLEIFVIAPQPQAIAIVGAIAWLALPGIALVHPFVARASRATIAAWCVGPALGFAFSVFGLLLFWSAGLQNWLAIICAPSLTWSLAWLARRLGVPALRLPAVDQRDVVALAIVLLLVPIITFAPYDHVAEPVSDGEAYRAYFTADFVWAMTVTAELAKGDVPPANPFLLGDTLNYYWMSHLLSGALYRNLAPTAITAEQVILLNALGFSLAFVGFFYWLARASGASPVSAAIAIAIGFLANSYEGLERLWTYWNFAQPLSLVTTINIDAVTRWFYQGMPVDGLQRLLLYQPHHLTGYATALAALWLVGLADDVTEIGVALWAGILLALAFLFSTFTAIIVGAGVGLLYAFRLLRARAYGAIWQCAILGAAPVAVGVGISTVLGYTDPEHGLLLQLGLNPVATRRWPLMLFLSFGPLLLIGVTGLLRSAWASRDGLAPTALVVSAIVFYFVADVPDMEGVWVGWRSGHLLLVAFSVSTAAVLTHVWRSRALTLAMIPALCAATALALPTVAIDVYNAQDISNRSRGPAFPWTTIITPPEREALTWIRRHTPPQAIVQMEPIARDAEGWAYIPAHAERRMAAGVPISMIPLRPYLIASENVRAGIFAAAQVRDAHAMARALRVDYLFVGSAERYSYPGIIERWNQMPEFFPKVFENAAVAIFRVAP